MLKITNSQKRHIRSAVVANLAMMCMPRLTCCQMNQSTAHNLQGTGIMVNLYLITLVTQCSLTVYICRVIQLLLLHQPHTQGVT